MKLTPDDIVTRVFSQSAFGGYRKREVLAFLERISSQWEELLEEKSKMAGKLREKEAQLDEYRNRENLLREAITTAQQTATRMQAEAEKKSQEVVQSAHQKAEIIVQDARDSLKTVYQDMSNLRRVHIQLKNTLKAVLQSHQDLLEQDPVHTLLPQMGVDVDEAENQVSQTLEELSSKAKDLL